MQRNFDYRSNGFLLVLKLIYVSRWITVRFGLNVTLQKLISRWYFRLTSANPSNMDFSIHGFSYFEGKRHKSNTLLERHDFGVLLKLGKKFWIIRFHLLPLTLSSSKMHDAVTLFLDKVRQIITNSEFVGSHKLQSDALKSRFINFIYSSLWATKNTFIREFVSFEVSGILLQHNLA